MKILTKDQILAVDDLRYETVEVPEWGGVVRLRTMTGAERNRFEARIVSQSRGSGSAVKVDHKGLKALLLSMTMVDEKGSPFFASEEEAEKCFAERSGTVQHLLFEKAADLNGLGADAVTRKMGNSESDRNA